MIATLAVLATGASLLVTESDPTALQEHKVLMMVADVVDAEAIETLIDTAVQLGGKIFNKLIIQANFLTYSVNPRSKKPADGEPMKAMLSLPMSRPVKLLPAKTRRRR